MNRDLLHFLFQFQPLWFNGKGRISGRCYCSLSRAWNSESLTCDDVSNVISVVVIVAIVIGLIAIIIMAALAFFIFKRLCR